MDGENSAALPIVGVLAVIFHILFILVVPFFLSLHWKPRIITRPPTFELIQIQTPQPAARAKPTPPKPVVETPPEPPRPVEPPTPTPPTPPTPTPPQPVRPEPRPEPQRPAEQPRPQPQPQQQPRQQPQQQAQPRPQPQVVEEDISALEELFATPAPAASAISLTISEPFPFQWYLDQLQERIRRRWNPGPNERGEVIVQFTITRNGSMEGLRLVTSSGRAVLDRQAMQAVEMAAPFAALPAGFGGQSLTVHLTLRPHR